MSILPKLLYPFFALPVRVPISQFQEWDKQISQFIWGGRKPRVKYSTMTISKEGGGMALPNLKDYFYSAQIRTVVDWCDSCYEAKWKDIESESNGIPIQAMIGDFK